MLVFMVFLGELAIGFRVFRLVFVLASEGERPLRLPTVVTVEKRRNRHDAQGSVQQISPF